MMLAENSLASASRHSANRVLHISPSSPVCRITASALPVMPLSAICKWRHGREPGAMSDSTVTHADPRTTTPDPSMPAVVVRIRRIAQSAAVLVAILAIALPASALARTTRDVVKTRAGAVHGLAHSAYRVFQGIPYAAPPVGPRRWRPPEPVAPWKGIRDATRPGSPCAQVPLTVLPGKKSILPGASNLTGSTSENCLYLNVWTPARPTLPRPVFVWFHGGNDIYGAGRTTTTAQSSASRAGSWW